MRRYCDTSIHHCVLVVDTRCAQRLRRLRTALPLHKRAGANGSCETLHVRSKRFICARCETLHVRSRVHDRTVSPKRWHQNAGTKTLAPKRWHQNAGTKTLAPKRWHQRLAPKAGTKGWHQNTVTKTLSPGTDTRDLWEPGLASGRASIAGVSGRRRRCVLRATQERRGARSRECAARARPVGSQSWPPVRLLSRCQRSPKALCTSRYARNGAERGLQNLPARARAVGSRGWPPARLLSRCQRSPKAPRTSRYAGTARSAVSRICRTRARSASPRSRSGGLTGPP
jgi:hypothetical protein